MLAGDASTRDRKGVEGQVFSMMGQIIDQAAIDSHEHWRISSAGIAAVSAIPLAP
jgi:hypothetical protein